MMARDMYTRPRASGLLFVLAISLLGWLFFPERFAEMSRILWAGLRDILP